MPSWFLIGQAEFHLLILASLATAISVASQTRVTAKITGQIFVSKYFRK
jgi:hypothetical protein